MICFRWRLICKILDFSQVIFSVTDHFDLCSGPELLPYTSDNFCLSVKTYFMFLVIAIAADSPESAVKIAKMSQVDIRIPEEEELEESREIRRKERKMHSVGKELITYLVFLFLMLTVCYGNRTDHGFLMIEDLKNSLTGFSKVLAIVHEWVDNKDNYSIPANPILIRQPLTLSSFKGPFIIMGRGAGVFK